MPLTVRAGLTTGSTRPGNDGIAARSSIVKVARRPTQAAPSISLSTGNDGNVGRVDFVKFFYKTKLKNIEKPIQCGDRETEVLAKPGARML